MGFLYDYEHALPLTEPLRSLARKDLILEWLTHRPLEACQELLRERPVFLMDTFPFAILVKHADVLQAFEDHTRYAVPYASKCIEGELFTLMMDAGEQHTQERQIIHRCLSGQDLPHVHQFVAHRAKWALRLAQSQRVTIDLIEEIIWPTLLDVVRVYFGVAGMPTYMLQRWMHHLHRHFLRNYFNNKQWMADAVVAFHEMNTYLQHYMSEGLVANGSVFDRLTRSGLAPNRVRTNVIGLTVATVDTTLLALARAFDQLLSRGLISPASDMTYMHAGLCEALRMNPQTSFVPRVLTEETTVRGVTLPKDCFVLLSTLGAMHDPDVIDEPGEFKWDRPRSQYLFFGHGIHKCSGQDLAPTIMAAIAQVLLAQPGLTRDDADPFDPGDPFPEHLLVTYAPESASTRELRRLAKQVLS